MGIIANVFAGLVGAYAGQSLLGSWGPSIAGLIGVFLACLIVSFGFFKTIFVLILGALGVAAGLYIEKNYIDK